MTDQKYSGQAQAGGQGGPEAGTSTGAEPWWRLDSMRTVFQSHKLFSLMRACEEQDNPFHLPVR